MLIIKINKSLLSQIEAKQHFVKFIFWKQSYEIGQKANIFFLTVYKKVLKNLCKTGITLNKNTDVIIKTNLKNLLAVLYFLNKSSLLQFKQLIDIVCYDKPEKLWRFTLHYLLFSVIYNANIIVSLKTSELMPVPTITKLYLSGFWLEREVWDLFGVFFEKNTKLSRILTDYGFTFHPLRKDFPLTGFKEVSYSYSEHRMISTNVELSQESRFFAN